MCKSIGHWKVSFPNGSPRTIVPLRLRNFNIAGCMKSRKPQLVHATTGELEKLRLSEHAEFQGVLPGSKEFHKLLC